MRLIDKRALVPFCNAFTFAAAAVETAAAQNLFKNKAALNRQLQHQLNRANRNVPIF